MLANPFDLLFLAAMDRLQDNRISAAGGIAVDSGKARLSIAGDGEAANCIGAFRRAVQVAELSSEVALFERLIDNGASASDPACASSGSRFDHTNTVM